MEYFKELIERIENPSHREKVENMLSFIFETFPNLEPKIGWNQPMFTDHGTYIIGFSFSKNHMSIGPEKAALRVFNDKSLELGYELTKETIKIPWKKDLDLEFLKEIIQFNIEDKANCDTFWRK